MSRSLSINLQARRLAMAACAILVILMAFAMAPRQAHAAALTVTAATTTSNNASTTLARVGNTFHFGLQLNGTPVATSTPVINIQGMGTSTMTGVGAFWEYSTTTSASWNTGAVQFLFAYGDSTPGAGATTTKSQANLTGSNVTIDKTAPTIASVTSDATSAGVLKVGDTITFTLTPGATEYGARPFGAYNGRNLTSWSTTNGGVTYTKTYTVTEGDTDQSSAVQISASIADAAENLSAATTTGSDVVKTIDANSPSTPTADIPAGSYTSLQHVVLSSTGSNSVRYTADGTTPTCSSNPTTGAVTVNETETIKAVGCDSAGNISSVGSFAYTVSVQTSRHNGGGGGGGSSHVTAPVILTPSAPAMPTVPSGAVVSAFARSLTVGATGSDVMDLQKFLNAHGFVVAASGAGSPGMETSMFGGLTRAALAKFQAANGISPAAGFFGPITRAFIAAMK